MRTRLRLALLASALAAAVGCGEPLNPDAGRIEGAARRGASLAAAEARQRAAAPPGREDTQILFGDLHVHTSFSWDGLLMTLPLIGGEGSRPPADACDFARYCSALDFFALTDHAESLTMAQWEMSKESIRSCNAVAGDTANPDLVAFMGFEWSQVGFTPETHWGHRCVVFPETSDDALPVRPIDATSPVDRFRRLAGVFGWVRLLQPQDFRTYQSVVDELEALSAGVGCADEAEALDPESTCRDLAPTPRDLHERLDRRGFEALAIPHGMTWGTYTPAGSDIRKHLDPEQYDPKRAPVIEVMSGHGNSEEFRRFRAFERDADGQRVCPEPTPDFLPCCWQAGEIMRSRCGDLADDECERRVRLARHIGANTDTRPHSIFPDAELAEWLDCDQCRDCFKPSMSYRPRESVQYALALRNDAGAEPVRFRYGFVASSDNHTARPGTGYKQIDRTMTTDIAGDPGPWLDRIRRHARRMDDPRTPLVPGAERPGLANADMRIGSFLYPGGLAAVHAAGRDRRSIWEALERRETYGTSGPRILLWFDLVLPDGRRLPMGSEARLDVAPRFEVRAVGDFVQEPGCPADAIEALSPERLRKLCRGECRNPGDRRHAIEAIEIVRIRPQRDSGEAVAPLVEDPWKTFACEGSADGCVAGFEDTDFATGRRDAVYYARALQEPTPAINGANLATRFDADGNAVSVDVCMGPDTGDGCPAPVRERAWSSPIFVDFAAGTTP